MVSFFLQVICQTCEPSFVTRECTFHVRASRRGSRVAPSPLSEANRVAVPPCIAGRDLPSHNGILTINAVDRARSMESRCAEAVLLGAGAESHVSGMGHA